MTEKTTWKILIYTCGNASEHLPDDTDLQTIDLAPLFNLPAGAFTPSSAILLVEGHNPFTRQALRFVQEPGQSTARLLATVDGVDDSPAARDAFAAWAVETYPTDRTLLFLADCKAGPDNLYQLPGTAFELVDSPDGPDQRPLNQAMLDEVRAQLAGRSALGQLLARLLAAILGDKQEAPPAATPAPPAQPAPAPEDPTMQPQRDWTIMIYMAGDNGKVFKTQYGNYALMAEMTTAGTKDIGELQKAGGTTDNVAVLVQFDTRGEETGIEKGSYRLEIGEGAQSWQDHVVEVIPEANTGDPAELARFVVWGLERYPARNALLVLWNHGLGWKDDDVYASVRSLSRSARSGYRPRRVNAAAFLSTARRVRQMAEETEDDETRGILCDDSSMDFLTNVEMSQALRVAEVAADEADVSAIFADPARLQQVMAAGQDALRRRLSIIGMDACLMAMLEVQYQVRGYADIMVASQEVEPMAGWPYTPIVQALNARSAMSPQELATVIVDEYARSYSGTRSSNITQSAVDLGQMEQARALVADFAAALRQLYPADASLQLAFSKAAKASRRLFEDPEYVDLAGFIASLLERYGAGSEVGQKGRALLDWIHQRDGGPVIRNAATGKYEGKASGLSIYLSRDLPSPLYADLDFARSGWLDLLKTVYEAV